MFVVLMQCSLIFMPSVLNANVVSQNLYDDKLVIYKHDHFKWEIQRGFVKNA